MPELTEAQRNAATQIFQKPFCEWNPQDHKTIQTIVSQGKRAELKALREECGGKIPQPPEEQAVS